MKLAPRHAVRSRLGVPVTRASGAGDISTAQRASGIGYATAALLPGAMRGLRSEANLSTYSDLDRARRGLTRSIATYLGQS